MTWRAVTYQARAALAWRWLMPLCFALNRCADWLYVRHWFGASIELNRLAVRLYRAWRPPGWHWNLRQRRWTRKAPVAVAGGWDRGGGS